MRARVWTDATCALTGRCVRGAGAGRACRAAPKLKDADINEDRARELYLQLVKTVRTMYHTCRLVHADLSEYNLLYVRAKRGRTRRREGRSRDVGWV